MDHFTKLMVVGSFEKHEKLPVIPGFFDLVYVTNKGAAWGMFSEHSHVLLIVSIIVLCLMLVFIRTLCEGYQERYYAIAMILSGIVGNMIDRVWRNQVVDFLDFYIGNKHWPAFNVADSAITVGVAIYIISNVFRSPKQLTQEEGNGGGDESSQPTSPG